MQIEYKPEKEKNSCAQLLEQVKCKLTGVHSFIGTALLALCYSTENLSLSAVRVLWKAKHSPIHTYYDKQ